MSQEETNHAYENAKGWMEEITKKVRAMDEENWERLEELRDERDAFDGDSPAGARDAWMEENGDELRDLEEDLKEFKDADEARNRVQEDPLSVQVRSGWTTPGETMEAEEFEILLSTGGPALRIRGELNQHQEPDRAWLEYQDWGTPWTEYHGENASQDDLLVYSQTFYFGN